MTASGNTTITGNEANLTVNDTVQVGTIWSTKKINLNADFSIKADLYFGEDYTTTDNGGDGIAFVLQPLSSNGGTAGGGLGYEYISPSLAIEFDTFSNDFDPYDAFDTNPNDHITIIKNGDTANPIAHSEYINPIDIGNLEDGTWYTVEIEWVYTTNTLKLTVDNTIQFENNIGDITASIFSNNPNVYLGFTASTGDSFNEQSVKNIAFCASFDTDEDTIFDVDDNCPAISNTDQLDTDSDGVGDVCDDDIDGDGIININDNCPLLSNTDQLDTDLDGIGDVCDDDIDGDNVLDTDDLCLDTPFGEIVNSNGCIYIDCDNIPEIVASSNNTCPNELVSLKLDYDPIISETSFLWSTGGTTNSIDIYPISTENYWVDITIKNTTCRKEITVNISDLSFPKFFTPNGDGKNDTWQMRCVNGSLVSGSIINIFNRFGKVVAQINPLDKGWDGYYNGHPLPSSDYWFTVQFTDALGNLKEKRGNFSLIRR
jgi:gliding motility-associated-like protein